MDDVRQLVARYWQTMNTNDWEAVGTMLHDEFVLDWPQSGERIRGRNMACRMGRAHGVARQYPLRPMRERTLERLSVWH